MGRTKELLEIESHDIEAVSNALEEFMVAEKLISQAPPKTEQSQIEAIEHQAELERVTRWHFSGGPRVHGF